MGRATCGHNGGKASGEAISIHALRGEGDSINGITDIVIEISIHALRGEGDTSGRENCFRAGISIHALRGEGDSHDFRARKRNGYFNPRPPWGGRPYLINAEGFYFKFQSTPSVGRATLFFLQSIRHGLYFNPRPPWGGRHCKENGIETMTPISIHALRGEGDQQIRFDNRVFKRFQSTPSVGRATIRSATSPTVYVSFQSTPSVGRATENADGWNYHTDDFNPRPPWGGRRAD